MVVARSRIGERTGCTVRGTVATQRNFAAPAPVFGRGSCIGPRNIAILAPPATESSGDGQEEGTAMSNDHVGRTGETAAPGEPPFLS